MLQRHFKYHEVVLLLGFVLHTCMSENNYALRRYAWQKDTFEGIALASRAVDGNSSPEWDGISSCAMTQTPEKPWWAVDLGQAIRLSRVVVTSKGDPGKILHRIKYTNTRLYFYIWDASCFNHYWYISTVFSSNKWCSLMHRSLVIHTGTLGI